MSTRIVIVSEKTSISRHIAPFAVAAWPDSERYVVHTRGFSAIRFRYPRGLGWKDVPMVSQPSFMIANGHQWGAGLIGDNGEISWDDSLDPEYLIRSSTPVFCCDPDHTGCVTYLEIMRLLRNELGGWHPAVMLTSICERDLSSAFRNIGRFSDFSSLVSFGEAKRYIDWNWNINATVLIGSMQRLAGGNLDSTVISKYGLQMLYYLRRETAQTEGALINEMQHWKGTGRYQGPCQLGSLTSQCAIIEHLLSSGLAVRDDVTRKIMISSIGEKFLSLLHPDCEDPDLPFRVARWCGDGISLSRFAIDRYVRTFFGKQKRYAARASSKRTISRRDSFVSPDLRTK